MAIRVARIITRMPVGGIEKKIVRFFETASHREITYRLVCIHELGPLAEDVRRLGVPVTLVRFRSRLDPRGLLALACWLRRERIDIMHSHMYRANTSGTIAAMLSRAPRIITHMHNVDSWDTVRQIRMDRRLNRFRDRVIAVSSAVATNLEKVTGLDRARIEVIHNGVDLDAFQPGAPPPGLREALGVPGGGVVVGMVARLVRQKAPELFVEAARRIVAAGDDRTCFLLIGGGPMEDELHRQIAGAGLEKRFFMAGERHDIPALLRCLDLFVLPSHKEGFSNAILEAGATGLPVVATAVGGNAEVIVDGENGYLVAPGDIEMLADRLRALLADPGLRAAMAGRALVQVRAFSMSEMVRKTEDLYIRVMDENSFER
ncbi:glycosyltransferase [bacterium]|nr:glycosyltransferase [candidate division CSSED10-310 bacterium]